MDTAKRRKLLVLNPFAVYPPVSGGQGRVVHLFKNMTHSFDVLILCYSDRRSYKEIYPGLVQLTIPKSPRHCKFEREFVNQFGIYTCALGACLGEYTPEFGYFLAEHLQTASFVFLSHPYLVQQLEHTSHRAAVIYDAHNVEYDLHQLTLPVKAQYLLNNISQAEKIACQQARLITTCSQRDADRLAALYTVPASKFQVVPNGADLSAIPFIARKERQRQKALQDMNYPVTLFIGSDFSPNIEAVMNILILAKASPNVRFWIAGSVCNQFTHRKIPANIEMLGILTEQQKRLALGTANIALNPVSYGSGTSLKMLEYMAAGIPLITTPFGARGINGVDGLHFLVCNLEAMPDKIADLLQDHALADRLSTQAYELVKREFEWRQIAARLVRTLNGW